MFRTGAQFMIVVLIVGLLLVRESRLEPLNAIDESFADFLSRNSRRVEEPAPITLVAIDNESLKDHAWPWTPLDFALFFQAANPFRPEVLATNELLSWTEEPGTDFQSKLVQYKKILREHLLRAPKVLLGAQLGYPEDPEVIPPLAEVPLIRNVTGDLTGVQEFTAIQAQPEEDFRLSSTVGFTNLPQLDGPVHSVPLIARYRGQVVPAFILQAILLWEKLTPDDISVEIGRRITIGRQFDIPIDRRGRMRVDFGVPRGRCSFEDLVLASAQLEADRTPSIPAEMFSGKLVFLARTDPDAGALPFSAGRSGTPGELFGAAIATIQNRSFIKRASFAFDWGVLFLAVVASYWAPRWRAFKLLAWGGLGLVIYALLALSVFAKLLVWFPILLPGGLLLFIVLFRAVTPGAPGHPAQSGPRRSVPRRP